MTHPASPIAPPTSPAVSPPLPREVAYVLVQLAIGLNRTQTYPENHPVLQGAITALHERLAAVLASRQRLVIGVARSQLIVEDATTDAKNPLFRDLAHRLHVHQIGTLTFDQGVTLPEVGRVLRALAQDSWRTGEPLGMRTGEAAPRWRHVSVAPFAVDQLVLGRRESAARARSGDLWVRLAHLAVDRAERAEELTGEHLNPAELGRLLREAPITTERDRDLLGCMVELGQELGETSEEDGLVLRHQFSQLLSGVGMETLLRLVQGATPANRQAVLFSTADYLPVGAVLDLVQACAGTTGQDMSHAFLRMLTKLARHAEAEEGGGGPETAFRESVRQLVQGWELEDPNPQHHRRLLEVLARTPAPVAPSREAGTGSEAMRLVLLALETETIGPAVLRAFDELIARDDWRDLLTLIESAGENKAADQLFAHLATPEMLQRFLSGDDPSISAVVDRLIRRLGVQSVPPLIEALEVAESQAARRRLLDHLSGLGEAAGPALAAALPDAPWYLKRNLLLLLGKIPDGWPSDFSPQPYARHADVRVRREAVKLMVRHSAFREAGIAAGVADSDLHVIQTALTAAQDGCPAGVASILVSRLRSTEWQGELRRVAARVLSALRTPVARDWMVATVMTKTRFLRRPCLIPKSPELLILLESLAASWNDHPRVQAVLALARRHSDPDIARVGTASGDGAAP